MAIEIRVPSVGESISEVFIGEWYVKEGEWVDVDQNLVGLETDKATFDVPSPEAGVIDSIKIEAGSTAEIGDVIATLNPGPNPNGDSAGGQSTSKAESTTTSKESASQQSAQSATTGGHVMPSAARVAAESHVDPKSVGGTGPGGRVLKEDVLNHVGGTDGGSGREERRVPMSPMRQTIARRLVSAQKDAALLTTFNECDMSAVKKLRAEYQDQFVKKYDIKLGFMSFFVKAVIGALNEFPAIGAQVEGTDLVYRNYCDVGVAIGAGKGLIVPVIRNAERLSFAEVELTIADFAKRARNNKITLEELEGGTFTITNGGVYGSLLSTPIVNPPQSGVLGMHGIFDRPVAVDGEVVIRPMMYIALTYDHRVVDGREAVSFLVRIKEAIEDPTRLLLEV
ncbi:2-oxoglutarate dehydrogenase complex dihydrolipoyllysine-residue succinyltransferase [Thalassoglobus polymorphus]|uniref:Dihydrolipoyllysine-residue succinyltransferase component of 2-oxoglutarate dehydrogenase complex n=1 Tax=Thalassoglobus polymorphus TaxID=2527994 RepID=A0A517QNH3_9PLAN|nr:2-oxoglutarate dehydrogenase complex dihydrolipoyllysine-residue succinyltransferase [Thalassoglobus polymorphus]QDT33155.1 Dihydrolipoyllysine-residue succinyltransferase component of 2-oxoglutarate dehydrogenase complex [Thalassoglobus polymorphus]